MVASTWTRLLSQGNGRASFSPSRSSTGILMVASCLRLESNPITCLSLLISLEPGWSHTQDFPCTFLFPLYTKDLLFARAPDWKLSFSWLTLPSLVGAGSAPCALDGLECVWIGAPSESLDVLAPCLSMEIPVASLELEFGFRCKSSFVVPCLCPAICWMLPSSWDLSASLPNGEVLDLQEAHSKGRSLLFSRHPLQENLRDGALVA